MKGSARGTWDPREGQQPFRPNLNGVGDRTTTLADVVFFTKYSKVMKSLCQSLDILQSEEKAYYGILLPTVLVCAKKLTDIQEVGDLTSNFCGFRSSLYFVTKMLRVYALRYSRKLRLLLIAKLKPILTAQAARVHLPMMNFSAEH